jgi:hypothetical protein
MKNTETWVCRHTLSSENEYSKRVDPTRYNHSSAMRETLLSNGDVIKRPRTDGEIPMPIILMKEIRMNVTVDNRVKNARFLQGVYEVAIDKKGETPEQKKARAIVEFLKGHHEVSYKDMSGTQLNPNFPQNAKAYFELINLDERESQSAKHEILYNELIGSVIESKENTEDLNNLAYAFGLNPQSLSTDACFNLIKIRIQSNPIEAKRIMFEDTDKYHKIVVNKGLRVTMPNSESTYIVQDTKNMFYMNGQLLASNYDGLILYFKENKDMFTFLEDALGFKKKEVALASTKSKKASEASEA